MTTTGNGRLVLEGVPRVGFYPKQSTPSPEDHVFPSCMRAILEYLHDDIKEQLFPKEGDWHPVHEYMMGASGQAFEFIWRRGKWEDASWPITCFAPEDPLEPIRRATAAAGYPCKVILRSSFARELGVTEGVSDDEATYRTAIAESLARGVPVIAFGVVGPPDCSLITGYDNGGDVLIGWSFFQDDATFADGLTTEPSGYFRRDNWFAGCTGLIVLGEKQERPAADDMYREAIEWGLRLMRMQETQGSPASQAAYEAWAGQLVDEAAFVGADATALRDWLGGSDGAGGHIAEARAWGMGFLFYATAHEPAAAPGLEQAMGAFGLLHDLVWRLWQTTGAGDKPAKAQRFARPEVRAELHRIVKLFQALDAEAAAGMERALLAMGVDPATIPPAGEGERALATARQERRQHLGSAPNSVPHEGTSGTRVTGVPDLQFGQGQDCTFIGALAAATAPTLHPWSYTDLMGHSGLAFATRWFDNPNQAATAYGPLRWHPVSPHGERPETIAALTRATGWQLRAETMPVDPESNDRERLVTDMVLSVNDGLPVVATYNTDLGVIYGYHIWSANLFLQDYQHPPSEQTRIDRLDAKLQGPVIFLDSHTEPLTPREAFLNGLRLAVQDSRRETEDYFTHGLTALTTWRAAISEFDQVGAEDQELLYSCDWWSVMHLRDARQAAVAYLTAHRDTLDGPAGEAVGRALEAYREEAALLDAFTRATADRPRGFSGPAAAGYWAAELRRQQVDLMAECIRLETRALADLEAAIAAG